MSTSAAKTARTFKVRSNLANQIDEPGGRRISAAVSAAETALNTHRDGAVRSMSMMVEQLEALCLHPTHEGFAGLYPLAAGLAGMAGFFDTGPFYRAAYSLCELAEKLEASGRHDWPSVDVHVKTLRLLLNSGFADGAEAQAMLEGLAIVVGRCGVSEA